MVNEFESVQVVFFTHSPPTLDALKLWDTAFGRSPSGFQTHSPGHTQAQGQINGFELTLIAQLNRVDVLVQGATPLPPAVPPTPLSDLTSAIALAVDTAGKVAPYLQVGRCAAVLQGNSPATSANDAALKVVTFIPGVKIPQQSSGLNFEITVPMTSHLMAQRRIIRICKWQSVQSQLINFVAGQTQMQPQLTQRFAAHVYVDVYVEVLEAMDTAAAQAALGECIVEAERLIMGTYNDLV